MFVTAIAINELIVFIDMVAFARAKARSIISMLKFTAIAKTKVETKKNIKNENLNIKTEDSSNYFLEAIKKGGIWLS